MNKPPVSLTRAQLYIRRLICCHANSQEFICLCVMIFKKVKALDDIHCSPACVAQCLISAPFLFCLSALFKFLSIVLAMFLEARIFTLAHNVCAYTHTCLCILTDTCLICSSFWPEDCLFGAALNRRVNKNKNQLSPFPASVLVFFPLALQFILRWEPSTRQQWFPNWC